MKNAEEVDWSKVLGVEIKPNVQSGAPVFAGTRTPISNVTNNIEKGGTPAEVEKILQNFDVTREQVNLILHELRRPASFKPLASARS